MSYVAGTALNRKARVCNNVDVIFDAGRDEPLASALGRMLELAEESRLVLVTPDADQWRKLSLMRWEMLYLLGNFADRSLILSNCSPYKELYNLLYEQSKNLLGTYLKFVEQWQLCSQSSLKESYLAEADQIALLFDIQLANYGEILRNIK